MWSSLTKVGGVTDTVTLPEDGIVSVIIPDSVDLCAYVNGAIAPMHHIHVKSGDSLYFELKSHKGIPVELPILYNGTTEVLRITPEDLAVSESPEALYQEYDISPKKIYKQIKEQEMTPAETINLFANPGFGNNGAAGMGAGAGAGLGAGLLGGVLGGALLGGRRGGLLGGDGDVVGGGVVTPALLASTAAQITDTAQATTVLQTLGDIKASIPLAEGQVQLALAGAQADINGNISMALQTAINGQAGINANISNAIATSLASQGAIKDTVQETAAATQLGIAGLSAQGYQNTAAVLTAVKNDGDQTRALINSIDRDNLNRQLTLAEQALLEQRSIGRTRDLEVNVTQNVNQNQAQLQAQAQQQQQFLITNNLLQELIRAQQIATATNQSLIIGNTGAVTGGAQTANPVNVRA